MPDSLKCPRDASAMQFQGYWKHPRHVCGSCHGQLLSEGDVMEALGHAEHSTFSTAAAFRIAKLPESAIACPRDEKAMRVILYEGIVLDFVGDALGSVFDGLL